MEIGDIIFLYMVHATHFTNAGPVVQNVGGVKCQPLSNVVTT